METTYKKCTLRYTFLFRPSATRCGKYATWTIPKDRMKKMEQNCDYSQINNYLCKPTTENVKTSEVN